MCWFRINVTFHFVQCAVRHCVASFQDIWDEGEGKGEAAVCILKHRNVTFRYRYFDSEQYKVTPIVIGVNAVQLTIYTSRSRAGSLAGVRKRKLPSAKIDGSRSRARRGAKGVENNFKSGYYGRLCPSTDGFL
jgi:hypothetical protein